MEIFSGEYSRKMWNEINRAKTVDDLRDALYTVCCRLQELETALASASPNKVNRPGACTCIINKPKKLKFESVEDENGFI